MASCSSSSSSARPSKHISLLTGWPSTSLFPRRQLLQGATGIIESEQKAGDALVYGPFQGYEPLRERIAAWLSGIYREGEGHRQDKEKQEVKQDPISADRICISNGASANLQSVLIKFTGPAYTRAIWMVEPCYFLACPIFTDAGFAGELRGVPEDDEGLDIDFLRDALAKLDAEAPSSADDDDDAARSRHHPRYPKLYRHVIYAVPTFANPSGKTMSLRRRQELVRLARKHDALVVTDDVYDVLRWPEAPDVHVSELGPVPPRIVDVDGVLDGGPQDEWGNALSNGSFSKYVAPGLRTGWAEGTPALALALSSVGATRSGGVPSHFSAAIIDEMMASGQLATHISDTLIPTYRARYVAMHAAIREHLAPLGFTTSTGTPYRAASADAETGSPAAVVAGGYFVFVMAPRDLPVSVSELAALALERQNLKIAYGDMMTVEGDPTSLERARVGFGNGIRLCWAWHTAEEIVEGIQRLARLVSEIRARASCP